MVRVIAGTARGTKLKTIDSDATKPTLDRVKEAMFSMLMPYLPANSVLDLFSGNGSLGIEALSRGSEKCVFNDKSKDCCAIIRENIQKVHFDSKSEVYSADFQTLIETLKRKNAKFDMLLLDPPYGKGLIDQAIYAFERAGLYTEFSVENGTRDCVILAEHSAQDKVSERYGRFVLNKTKKYGTVAVSIYCLENGEE